MAIATMAILFRKRSAPSPICPICLGQEKTIEHLFLQCPWVVSVWANGALNFLCRRSDCSNWVRWWLSVFSTNLGSSESSVWVLSYVAFSCWHIWRSQCDFVFNNVPVNSARTLMGISNAVAEFFNAWSAPVGLSTADHGRGGQAVFWSPPSSPFTKVNVDASWSRLNASGFVAVVVRDAKGVFIAAARYPLSASCVALAEAIALLRGCELAISLGLSLAIFEFDYLGSISCLSNSLSGGNWVAYPILALVRDLDDSFQFCRWFWVPRSANLAADSLASVFNTEMCNVVWVNRPPSSLVFVLNNDGLPCPH